MFVTALGSQGADDKLAGVYAISRCYLDRRRDEASFEAEDDCTRDFDVDVGWV